MEWETKVDAKSALIGLAGIFICLGSFIFFAAVPEQPAIPNTLQGFLLLGALFFGGYAAAGNILTAAAAPLVMFVTFQLAGHIKDLPEGEVRSFLLAKSRALGSASFLLAIVAAVYVHKWQSR